ncbi:pentatricopeptide repeat-containing protein At1g50270 isoform X2 [Andrographis paniculata]|uniref:pentatricopeptide repeat-containing protein At1g50270 isoform X2 n=1 Tax=Andrographis paniculata TaxID=175694 RepID=UPI0021E94202|nr:pentatricopeptide repeat-containing protein At1g50270 isoform X2 [Andrographis paniculata]
MHSSRVSNNLSVAGRYLWQHFHRRNRLIRRESPPPELSKLQQIHSLLVVSGCFKNSTFLTRLLLHCVSIPTSASASASAYALSIFNQIRRRDVSTYNAAIRAFIFDHQNAVSLYIKMRREGVVPNQHTFPLLFKSKTQMPLQIFTQSIKFGFGSDGFVCNSLISVLAGYGLIRHARQVFDEMTDRDAVAYTALMDGYVKNNRADQALELFLEMRSSSSVDEVAVATALCAVAMTGCIWLGRWIHGFYVESGRVLRDVVIGSALIDMYSKGGCPDDAAQVFREMPRRNVVSWNALLSGYVQCNRCKDSLHLFHKMLVEKVEPNEAVLATTLTACAHLGSLNQGRWIDKYIEDHKMELNSVLGTALIDMYAKCGCIHDAFLVFHRIRTAKDVYPWTALIFGLAMNGDAPGALTTFDKMLADRVQPNEVTITAVLCACTHGGLVRRGQEVFASMEDEYGIKPTVDHYGCLVDLLGRAGQLEEAVKLIAGMPMEPSGGVWGALFNACTIHKDFELGKSVGSRMIRLEPSDGSVYTRLANMYCKHRDWEAAAAVRKKMHEMGVEKTSGCSAIEVDGAVREFVASDARIDVSEDLYGAVESLAAQGRPLPEAHIRIFCE